MHLFDIYVAHDFLYTWIFNVELLCHICLENKNQNTILRSIQMLFIWGNLQQHLYHKKQQANTHTHTVLQIHLNFLWIINVTGKVFHRRHDKNIKIYIVAMNKERNWNISMLHYMMSHFIQQVQRCCKLK